VSYTQDIIRNTIISIKKNKILEIFSNNDANLSITLLNELYQKTTHIINAINKNTINKDGEKLIDLLQKAIDKLSMIICGFGTQYLDDLLFIIFGSEFKNIKTDNKIINAKYDLIKKYIQPTGYKVIHWKQQKLFDLNDDKYCCNKITEETIVIEDSNMFECFDVEKTTKTFYQKIHGVRIVIQNEKMKKTLIINGIVEDIQLECFSNEYIDIRKAQIEKIALTKVDDEKDIILRLLDTLTFKDILIYGNEDICKKMIAVFAEVNYVKQTKLDITIKKFLELDVCSQRNMLINLLIYNKDDEIQYISYLLYDLISASSNDTSDNEKLYIYESLPWKIKMYFKDVVKYTIKYTNDMMQKYDIHKITLEQQIYLLKTNDNIKEKAMMKLKEIKGKSDDSGLKAKQYLEGLVKIPFGSYKEEPILKKIKEINRWFMRTVYVIEQFFPTIIIQKKEKYTIVEIIRILRNIDDFILNNVLKDVNLLMNNNSNKQIVNIVQYINSIKKNKKEKRIPIANQSRINYIDNVVNFLSENTNDLQLILDVYDLTNKDTQLSLSKTNFECLQIRSNISQVEKTMNEIINVLDDSIYSHSHAKNQIMKIIGQWMNGEQSGYCFGFEGSPGVGKTSLAKKGLANCLKDEEGNSRPFAFIALGGSSNGPSLEGHGYTYVNSTWGRIVDILMEAKCMNPIIYIDELDKVSKTENGKEIIGLFTHLIDQTQNETFQDKYFSGIDIDLSKALFIFSYNDPDQIDRILLDRIHRIKFENLTVDDKIVIVRKYILPEINTKMGFENIVEISDEIIEFIIDSYTIEPGVRKLKEMLFDLYGEINLNILKFSSENVYEIPVHVTKDNLENKYLVKYKKISEKKMHLTPEIGIINGLWANVLGRGGIIPVQTLFFPSSTFLELKLTGLQGDVMKESMNVAKSLAWNLTSNNIKKDWLKYFEDTKCQGLHIHCPEGSISKDGPSAGAAITTAIFSLLNKKLIKNDVAITGEINLNGEITAIGGLDIKILGGVKAGIKTFLFPKSNNREYMEWKNKHEGKCEYDNINFIEISNINEVFEHVFV
jgi:hypothetical protein